MENGSSMMSTDYSVREDDRKLFVGGLSWDTNEMDVREYFGAYGEVENVNLKRDPYTQKPRGFGFVLFKSLQPLEKVLATTSHMIKGKKVDPKRAKTRTGKIFVGGLTAAMTDDDLKNHFGQFGKIIEAELPFDKQKNQRRGFCFLTFEHEDMMKVVLKQPKHNICGKLVDVKKAEPKPEAGGFGMPGPRGGMRGGGGRGRGGFQPGWDYYSGYGYGGYGGYGYESFGNYGSHNENMYGAATRFH